MSHFTLVGVFRSQAMVSPTPPEMVAQAFEVAVRRAYSLVWPEAMAQLVRAVELHANLDSGLREVHRTVDNHAEHHQQEQYAGDHRLVITLPPR